MQDKDEFYIGYLPKAPDSIAKVLALSVVALFVISGILGFVIANSQEEIQYNTFEFGELTELTGVLVEKPVPNLVIKTGEDVNGKSLYKSILLVGFGKFGADKIVQHFQEQIDQPLKETNITIRGTLIYSDGMSLLELTEEKGAFVKAEPLNDESFPDLNPTISEEKSEIIGEIVDSKCYFGVMNPGLGKPHMSCAIRCVSGGIPAVLHSKNDFKETDYHIVLGENGEAINQHLLPYVADATCIKGKTATYFDWKIIYTDTDKGLTSAGCF